MQLYMSSSYEEALIKDGASFFISYITGQLLEVVLYKQDCFSS